MLLQQVAFWINSISHLLSCYQKKESQSRPQGSVLGSCAGRHSRWVTEYNKMRSFVESYSNYRVGILRKREKEHNIFKFSLHSSLIYADAKLWLCADGLTAWQNLLFCWFKENCPWHFSVYVHQSIIRINLKAYIIIYIGASGHFVVIGVCPCPHCKLLP